MSEDRIEREIVIAAPVERVWAVLTEPEHVGRWFGSGKPAEIDLRPGGIMKLDHEQYGIFPTRIEKVQPTSHFSYRWASGFPGEEATDDNSTLVEFTLVPDGDGTRVRVVETGFAALTLTRPEATRGNASYESHSEGWPGALNAFRSEAEDTATQP